ncbi:MAG: hypothetical protein ACPGF7_11550 [Pontibacterium sp.]
MKNFRAIFFLMLLLTGSLSHAESVVTNSIVSENSVSRQFLLSVFAMRVHQWSDGRHISVFVLPDDHPDHVQFVKSSLHIFPYQLRNIWDRAVFSGSGQSPYVVKSEEEMLEKLRTVEGAVGYINRDLKGEQGVKQLEVY